MMSFILHKITLFLLNIRFVLCVGILALLMYCGTSVLAREQVQRKVALSGARGNWKFCMRFLTWNKVVWLFQQIYNSYEFWYNRYIHLGSIWLDCLSIFNVFMHFRTYLFPRNPKIITVFSIKKYQKVIKLWCSFFPIQHWRSSNFNIPYTRSSVSETRLLTTAWTSLSKMIIRIL